MSLLLIAALVIAYLVLVAAVLLLMTTAKRTEVQARRENRRFARSPKSHVKPVPPGGRDREHAGDRRAG